MKRASRLAGAAIMAVGTLVFAPAATGTALAANHCNQPKWDVHPDKISTGSFRWGNGTAIRTAGFTDCTIVGRGYDRGSSASQGIDVHCLRTNDNGLDWVYARNTSTGKAGWARADAVYTNSLVIPPRC